jgi:hypothetical protein
VFVSKKSVSARKSGQPDQTHDSFRVVVQQRSSNRFFVTTISLIASAMPLTGHIYSGSSAAHIASRSLARLSAIDLSLASLLSIR